MGQNDVCHGGGLYRGGLFLHFHAPCWWLILGVACRSWHVFEGPVCKGVAVYGGDLLDLRRPFLTWARHSSYGFIPCHLGLADSRGFGLLGDPQEKPAGLVGELFQTGLAACCASQWHPSRDVLLRGPLRAPMAQAHLRGGRAACGPLASGLPETVR